MPRLIRKLLIGLAVFLVLIVGAIAIFAARFNPNDYKPQVIALVKEKTQRTLEIPGEIKLSFFPKLGVDLGRVRISEHASASEFASVEKARLSLALIPLLSKQLVVDRVQVEGLSANLRREKDGSTNFDDLLTKEDSKSEQKQAESSGGSQTRFDIDGVDVKNAHLVWDDRLADRKFEISKLDLQTGKLASGAQSRATVKAQIVGNNPRIHAALDAKTGFLFDLDKKRYAVDQMDAELKGAALDFNDLALKISGDADLQPEAKLFNFKSFKVAATGKQKGQPVDLKLDLPKLALTQNKFSASKVSGQAQLAQGERTVALNFQLPDFDGTPQAFSLPALTLNATIKDSKGTDARARLEGSLKGDIKAMLFTSPRLTLTLSGKQGSTPLDGNLSTQLNADLGKKKIELAGIQANMNLANPAGGPMRLTASGNARADLDRKNANANLNGKLDESSFDAKLGLSSFSPMAYAFDVGIDKLDADRYRAKPKAGGTTASTTASPGKTEAEQPIDLSALKDLRATGSLRVSSLKAQNIRMSNVRMDLKAADGRVDVNPMSATLYGGSLSGSMTAIAAKVPRIALRQNLSNINIGSLLKDAANKDILEGRGNVSLDVNGEGQLASQIKRSLAGSARLELRDGAIKGINIEKVISTAKARIGQIQGNAPPQTGTAATQDKTGFSELNGSFRISKGVAHNDDLRLKSPLLRVEGAGDVDIGEDKLDYLVKATVVNTLQGQGGPELQALKGLTIPVRLSGPFTSIGYKVDIGSVATDLVKKQLESRSGDLRGKAEEQLKNGLKGLFGR